MDNWMVFDNVNNSGGYILNLKEKKIYDLDISKDVESLVEAINTIEKVSDMHLEMARTGLKLFRFTDRNRQHWEIFWAKDLDDAWEMKSRERGREGVSIEELKPKNGASIVRGGW